MDRRRIAGVVVALWTLGGLTACGAVLDADGVKGEFQPLTFADAAALQAVSLPAGDLCGAAGVDVVFASAGQVFGFPVTLEAGQVVTAQAAGLPDLDVALGLYGPRDAGSFYGTAPVASDDDSGDGHLPALGPYTVVTGGTYLVVVWTIGGDGSGPLHLSVAVDGTAGCLVSACPGAPPVCTINEGTAPCDAAVSVVLADHAGETPRARCLAACAALQTPTLDASVCHDNRACSACATITGLSCAGCCHLSDQAVAPACDDDPCTVDSCDVTGCRHEVPSWVGEVCQVHNEFVTHVCPGTLVCDASGCPETGACDVATMQSCDGTIPTPDDLDCDGISDDPDECDVDADCTLGKACRCVYQGCSGGLTGTQDCNRCVDPKEGWAACRIDCSGADGMCPRGMACAQLTIGGEATFFCAAPLGLCGDCTVDADCDLAVGAACLAYGEARFCGTPCNDSQDCPVGYACQAGQGTAGDTGKQCRSLTCCAPACKTHADCDDGNVCTVNLCDPSQNTCTGVLSPNCCTEDVHCDDSDPCTDDKCILNACRNFAVAGNCCLDDNWCQANADDGDPCTNARCMVDQGRRVCRNAFELSCQRALPQSWSFDGAATVEDVAWTNLAYGPNVGWETATAGVLGPDAHLRWPDRTDVDTGIWSVVLSPEMDATMSKTNGFNVQQTTTVQFRVSHAAVAASPGTALKVYATLDKTPTEPLLVFPADQAVNRLVTLTLPEPYWAAAGLQIGFMIRSAIGESTGTWDVDDVVVASGVANEPVKSLVYVCPATGCGAAERCDVNTATRQTEFAAGELVDWSMGPCDSAAVVTCHRDADATVSVWNFFGFPAVGPFTWFLATSPGLGGGYGCQTLPVAVQDRCGADATFYCQMQVSFQCGDAVGTWDATLAIRDTFGFDQQLYQPLDSEVPLRIRVTTEAPAP